MSEDNQENVKTQTNYYREYVGSHHNLGDTTMFFKGTLLNLYGTDNETDRKINNREDKVLQGTKRAQTCYVIFVTVCSFTYLLKK